MQGSSRVKEMSNCSGMANSHQISCEEPLTRMQHIGGVKCHAGAGVNQRSNCTEIPHTHQNVAKAALEHMLL